MAGFPPANFFTITAETLHAGMIPPLHSGPTPRSVRADSLKLAEARISAISCAAPATLSTADQLQFERYQRRSLPAEATVKILAADRHCQLSRNSWIQIGSLFMRPVPFVAEHGDSDIPIARSTMRLGEQRGDGAISRRSILNGAVPLSRLQTADNAGLPRLRLADFRSSCGVRNSKWLRSGRLTAKLGASRRRGLHKNASPGNCRSAPFAG